MKIEITDKMKSDATTMLRGIRLGLINSKNNELKLYGITSTNLKIEAVDYLPTIATDGQRLLFNPLFILGIDDSDMNTVLSGKEGSEYSDDFKQLYSKKDRTFLEFCVVHEIDHCLYSHFTMVGNRDKTLYNIAADHRINNDCIPRVFGSRTNNNDVRIKYPIFNQLCLDDKYKDKKWTSFLIYEDLLEQQKQQQKQSGDDTNNNGGSGGNNPLDSHVYSEGGSGKPNGFDSFVKEVLGLPDTKVDSNAEHDSKLNNSRLKQAFIDSAKQIGGGVGREIIDKIKTDKPKIKWEKLLRKSLSGLVKTEVDPKRLHRRIHGLTHFLHSQGMLDKTLGMVRAGVKPEPEVNVHFFADMSGSIGYDDRVKMLSECIGIISQYKNFKLSVASWDTKVYNESLVEYTKKNKKDIVNHKFVGGGGTDANCIADYLSDVKLDKHTKIVIMSDMYFSSPDKLRTYSDKIIWVSTTKNMSHATRSIGGYIEYDNY